MELNTLLTISASIYICYSFYNLFIFLYKMSSVIFFPFIYVYKRFFLRPITQQNSFQDSSPNRTNNQRINLNWKYNNELPFSTV